MKTCTLTCLTAVMIMSAAALPAQEPAGVPEGEATALIGRIHIAPGPGLLAGLGAPTDEAVGIRWPGPEGDEFLGFADLVVRFRREGSAE